MSRQTTVRCEGVWCRESTRLEYLDAEGWTVDPKGRDLCKRCSSGKCAGTVGRRPAWMSPDQFDPCPCLLPLDHEGLCKCSHDVADDPSASSPSLPTHRLGGGGDSHEPPGS